MNKFLVEFVNKERFDQIIQYVWVKTETQLIL